MKWREYSRLGSLLPSGTPRHLLPFKGSLDWGEVGRTQTGNSFYFTHHPVGCSCSSLPRLHPVEVKTQPVVALPQHAPYEEPPNVPCLRPPNACCVDLGFILLLLRGAVHGMESLEESAQYHLHWMRVLDTLTEGHGLHLPSRGAGL